MGGLQQIARSSVFSRIAWGIVIGFVLLHGASVMFYGHEKMVSDAAVFAASTAERALLIEDVSRSRPELLDVLTTPGFSISHVDEPILPPSRLWPHSDEIKGVLMQQLIDLGFPRPEEVRFWYALHQGDMSLTLQLPGIDGWTLVQARSAGVRGHSIIALFWTTSIGVLILLLVLWATRRFTRALPKFAEAAERIGRDSSLPALPEHGPREIRRLGSAFNAMQSRVTSLLAERNTMLGALSHDVRTLVTRLSLRLDEIDDAEQRGKARQDVMAIGGILDEALAFSREEAGGEVQRAVDLPSLLQAVVDDEVDRGVSVRYVGPGALAIVAEPLGLRRAFTNLVSNGVRYGDAVTVTLSSSADTVVVDVTDRGPGIPHGERQRVLEPFVRLEGSRNRDTGGSGLGLTIVSNIVSRHGGSLAFLDAEAGFTVRVELPRRE